MVDGKKRMQGRSIAAWAIMGLVVFLGLCTFVFQLDADVGEL